MPEALAPAFPDEPEAPIRKVVLTSAPKIRAVYWCNFWNDALRPEFYKTRPVVVVSRDNRLDGPIIVVPLTTKPQGGNKWAHKLSENPIKKYRAIESWAICNHLYTVSCARLTQVDGGAPRLLQADFNAIVNLMFRSLPSPPVMIEAIMVEASITEIEAVTDV